jgi:hypothetical protein
MLPPFATPMAVAQPARLAITPKIDGKMEAEEWDHLATVDGLESYLQWEPQRVHIAARVPAGQDLLVSLDLRGDGWLQGQDNLEIRVRETDSVPDVSMRLLNATSLNGPEWEDAAYYRASATVAASSTGEHWVVEMTLQDPGTRLFPDRPDSRIGARFDVFEPDEEEYESYLPRHMTMLNLGMERGLSMPPGLQWRSEFNHGRSVIPGEALRVRFAFNGNDDLGLRRIEMRAEGAAQNDTSSKGMPFRGFDRRNNSLVDYDTVVSPGARHGYRVVRATVVDEDGREAVIQSSFEITPLVSFDFVEPRIVASEDPQTVKLVTYIRSNTRRRVDGVFRVIAPEGWKINGGSNQSFLIYNPRGSKRQAFGLVVPGGFRGVAPVTLVADFAGQQAERTIWISVP